MSGRIPPPRRVKIHPPIDRQHGRVGEDPDAVPVLSLVCPFCATVFRSPMHREVTTLEAIPIDETILEHCPVCCRAFLSTRGDYTFGDG